MVWVLACFLLLALNPRLSPEVYLKRPAHSDDWRLDIMLKKKAVRVISGRKVWWVPECRLVRMQWGEYKDYETSGEEIMFISLSVWQTLHPPEPTPLFYELEPPSPHFSPTWQKLSSRAPGTLLCYLWIYISLINFMSSTTRENICHIWTHSYWWKGVKIHR